MWEWPLIDIAAVLLLYNKGYLFELKNVATCRKDNNNKISKNNKSNKSNNNNNNNNGGRGSWGCQY